MNKIGILGGTFDPIHIGHLITAQKLIEIRELEKIIFIPAYISPHKLDKKHSSGEDRLNMVKLSISGISYFDYSDIEIKKSDTSYTIDTIKHFTQFYDNIELIIGYDNIEKFHTWKDPDEIISLVSLVVMQRDIPEEILNKDKYYMAAEFVNTPRIDISATEIRNRIKKDLPIDFLVTKEVKNYIFQNNLYK